MRQETCLLMERSKALGVMRRTGNTSAWQGVFLFKKYAYTRNIV